MNQKKSYFRGLPSVSVMVGDLTHFISLNLHNRPAKQYCSYCADEETEAEINSITCPDSLSQK